jgi:monoamine oxidase
MDRRKFLQHSSLATFGILMASSALASCRKETLFGDLNYEGKVLIIGAGAAGLYAGFILKSKGIDFQILEAAGRSGGRLGRLDGFADYPIDLGAQWLHGRNSLLGDLIKQTNTKISKDNSDARFWFNNALVDELPKDLSAIFEEGDDLPDISFQDYATQQGFGAEYKFLVETIAGDQGASASELSMKWNFAEEENWNSGENDFKFEQTFYDVLNAHITSQIVDQIQLSTAVSKIDYSADQIIVTDAANNTYTADKVILTVPIPILQDADIEFTPALPAEKIEAFRKIGMGPGMKVFLKFSTNFYGENIAGGPICAAYANDLIGKNGNDNVLLAFVMGDQAAYLSSLGSDALITSALLAELDSMFAGQATASYLNAHVEDWTTNPFVRGAYSYSKIGIGTARSIAAQPVDDKLFFAGEAMNLNGHHQTVHGAVETGYREVINILNSVEK